MGAEHPSNWGRWGPDDQRGTVNLITDDHVLTASRLVQSGRVISLSRELRPTNDADAAVFHEVALRRESDPARTGVASEAVTYSPHGLTVTHVDALSHMWDQAGMWNGHRVPHEAPIEWGAIDAWKGGMITRGVLLDIAALRPTGYVTIDNPVTGDELRHAARQSGIDVNPGDALLVYCGRERWEGEHGPYGESATDESNRGRPDKPGLHVSCVDQFHAWDISILVWDMLDATPPDGQHSFPVHSAISRLGLAIVDNAALGELADACSTMGRSDFMVVVAPLCIVGGTGSPVNPLVVL